MKYHFFLFLLFQTFNFAVSDSYWFWFLWLRWNSCIIISFHRGIDASVQWMNFENEWNGIAKKNERIKKMRRPVIWHNSTFYSQSKRFIWHLYPFLMHNLKINMHDDEFHNKNEWMNEWLLFMNSVTSLRVYRNGVVKLEHLYF